MITDINYLVERLDEQIQFWNDQHMPERAIDTRKARDTLMELEEIRLSAERSRLEYSRRLRTAVLRVMTLEQELKEAQASIHGDR